MIYFDINRITETVLPACKSIITDPRNTFEQMPRTGFYKNGFGLLTLIVLASTIVSVPFIGFVMVFLLPFVWGMLMLSFWAWAGYLSWAVKTFGGQKLNTVNAFQLIAYASVPMLVGMIPIANVVAFFWNLWLTWLGLVTSFKVKSGTAMMIVVVPVVLMTVSLVALGSFLITLVPQFGQMLNNLLNN